MQVSGFEYHASNANGGYVVEAWSNNGRVYCKVKRLFAQRLCALQFIQSQVSLWLARDFYLLSRDFVVCDFDHPSRCIRCFN